MAPYFCSVLKTISVVKILSPKTRGGAVAVGELENHTLDRILIDSARIQSRVRELGEEIARDYQGKAPLLVAILKGASIFHSDLVRSIDLQVSFDFMAVGSYGSSTQSSGEVRFLKDLDESVKGRDVILVEDILDTGLTLNYLLRNIRSRGPKSLKIAVLLNKPSRRIVDVKADYVGFDIPDDFVIGYGLDFNQYYRNLPDIWILKPVS
jgi:hypoxanthine phosphoribosyltransferase